MRKATIFIVVAFLLAFGVVPAYAAVPKLPHAFYGTVEINGSPAPDGTPILATVDAGDVLTTSQNPVETVGDSYGIDSPYLLVQGNITPGATITFYVNSVEAEGQTAIYEAGGGPTERDLSVTIAVPPPVEEPAVGPPTYYLATNLFGIEVRFRIDSDGKILKKIEATSEDGMLTVTIPKGTIALDKDGKRLKSLEVAVDESPPDPPEDAYIIGLAYDFGPDGATFDPPITFTWSYDPDDIPAGVAEEDLVVECYPKEIGEWEECISSVDPVTNSVTALVDHFTTFAIIGAVTPPPPPPAPAAFSLSNLTVQPAEVQPKEAVIITVAVANTGGTEGSYSVLLMINGIKEAEKSVTIAAGGSQDVSFTVAKEEAGSYSVVVDGLSASFTVVAPPVLPPPVVPPVIPPPINWPLIGGIIAAVVVVGVLIFFLVRRRAYQRE